MYELSKGTLHQIMNGRNIKRPVFQLLNYKRLPNLISDWYMLNVSDGLKMNEYTLLSIELNNLFKNGALTKYTIFKVTNYKLELTNDERQTLIITGCEVLIPGNQVRRIIGNPTIIEFEPETYKLYSPTAVHQEGDIMQPNTSRDTNIFSREECTVPIVTLNPDYNRQTIQGRVFNKSPILKWRKEKGQLFFIQMHIKSAEVKCVAFNDECDKFYDKIEDGKVYCISNYKLHNSMPQCKMFKNKYDIMMTKDTQIKECHDDGSIPWMHFDFCPISQVENKKKHNRIDVLGIVVKSSNIIQRRKKLLRNVDIVDNSQQGGAKICITLENQRAEEFDCSNGTMLAIKKARVDEFNGKILVVMTSSVIKINPDLPEAHELRTWYDGNNYLDNGIHFNIPTLTFKQVTEKKLTPSSPFTYDMIAKIDSINSENSVCMDCPESKCGKKLFKLFANKFRCNKCNIEHPNFKYYLQLEMNISDATGSHSLTTFNEIAAEIVGMPLQELINLKVNDNNAYVQKINDTVSKEYLFRLKREKKAFQGQLIETCICESVQPLLSRNTNQDVFAEQN